MEDASNGEKAESTEVEKRKTKPIYIIIIVK